MSARTLNPTLPRTLSTGLSLAALLLLGACGDQDDTSGKGDTASPGVEMPECPCDAALAKEGELVDDLGGDGGVSPGDTVLYTLSVAWSGGESCSEEGQICIDDALPLGLSFVGESSSDFSCSSDGASPETVSCCTGSLPGGSSFLGSVTLKTVANDELVEGELENCASLSSDSEKLLDDTDPTNDSDCAVLEAIVPEPANLQVVKWASSELVAGEEGSWDFEVSNVGGSDAVGVVLEDTLPVGMTYVAHTPSDWTCTPDGLSPETVVCSYAHDLAAGDMASLSMEVALDYTVETLVENCVSVESDSEESTMEDNMDCASAEVSAACEGSLVVDLTTGVDDDTGATIADNDYDDTWMYLSYDVSSQYNVSVPRWNKATFDISAYEPPTGAASWSSGWADWNSNWSLWYGGYGDFDNLTYESCFCVGEDTEEISFDLSARADDRMSGASLNGVDIFVPGTQGYGRHDPGQAAWIYTETLPVDGSTVVRGTNCMQLTGLNIKHYAALLVEGGVDVGCGCDEADLSIDATATESKTGVLFTPDISNVGGEDEGRFTVTVDLSGGLVFDEATTEAGSTDWECAEDDDARAMCLYTGASLAPGAVDQGLSMAFTVGDAVPAEVCGTVLSRNGDVDASNDKACDSIWK